MTSANGRGAPGAAGGVAARRQRERSRRGRGPCGRGSRGGRRHCRRGGADAEGIAETSVRRQPAVPIALPAACVVAQPENSVAINVAIATVAKLDAQRTR